MTRRYNDFLLSEEWKKFAAALKIKRGNKCEICGSDEALQVHHLRYTDNLKDEAELTVLCCNCHSCIERLIKRFADQTRNSYLMTGDIFKNLMQKSILDFYQNSIYKPANRATAILSISQYTNIRDKLYKQILLRFPQIEFKYSSNRVHPITEIAPAVSLEESGVAQWRNAEIKRAFFEEDVLKAQIQKRFRLSDKAFSNAIK